MTTGDWIARATAIANARREQQTMLSVGTIRRAWS